MRSLTVALSILFLFCLLTIPSKASVVGLWQFNEASGNATDTSGNGNVGTFVGSNVTRAASLAGHGNALSVTSDQTNRAYVQVPGNYSLQIGLTAGTPWSVTAWAKENSDGFGLFYNTYGTILSQKDPAVSTYGLEYQSGTNGDEQYYDWHGNNTALQIATGVTPTLDVWNHYAWVYNGSDYIFYVNGTEKKRTTVGSQSLNYSGYTGALEIGSNITKSPTHNWDGLIDDVAVFNQALTPSDISTVMGGNFSPYISPLSPPTTTEWSVSGFGTWASATNWTPITLPSTSTSAVFGNKTTKPTTVVTDTAVTTKGLQFNHTQPYAIAGAGSVTIDSTSGNGSISVLNAGASVTEELQLPVILNKNTDVSAAAGTVLEFDNVLNLNGKVLNVSGAGRVNINNDLTAGTAGSVVNAGTLGGAGTIKGTLTNNAGATLAIDISGTGTYGAQGLTVTGAATLSGSLNISLLNGFTPAAGNAFTVLTAAGITNSGLTLSGSSAGFSLSVLGGTSLVLTYGGAGVPGDYNHNGIVDAADYVLWRDTLGSTTILAADGNSNGVVDQGDYAFWRGRFGNTSGSGSAVAAATVPEPCGAGLCLVLGAFVLGGFRSRPRLAFAGLFSLLLATLSSVSQATVLIFEGDVSNFNSASPPPASGNGYRPLGNGSRIVSEYGDNVSGATQTNVSTADFGNPPYWYNFNYGNNGEGYTPHVKVATKIIDSNPNGDTATRSWLSAGNLSKVAYPASTSTSGKWYYTFTADPGFSVSLISTDIARFNSTTLQETVNVYTGDTPLSLGSLLFTSGVLNVSDVAQTISPNVTGSALTLEFVLAGNGSDPIYNYAADNIVFAEPGPAPLTATWNVNGSGAWSKASNWTPVTVLNGTDKTAVFGNAITSPSTVALDNDYTLKKLQFNHTVAYNLSGTGKLTLQSSSGNASIEVLNAGGSVTHQINTNTILGSNLDVSVATGTTLEFDNRLHLGSFNLTKTGSGTLKINNVVETSGGSILGAGGSIGGSGQILGDLVNIGSTISPGNSPGVFTVAGNYSQSVAGTLHMEVGGLDRGTQYDVFKVGGQMSLTGGTLELVLVNNFVPQVGETFDLLDFGSIAGRFDHIQLPSDALWDTSHLLTDGTLTVTAVVPEPGTTLLAFCGVIGVVASWRERKSLLRAGT